MLDLVQFIDPPWHGQPYPTLTNIGICRIAFTADDIDKTYEELKAKKIECLAPLKKINGPTALSSEWSASWIRRHDPRADQRVLLLDRPTRFAQHLNAPWANAPDPANFQRGGRRNI